MEEDGPIRADVAVHDGPTRIGRVVRAARGQITRYSYSIITAVWSGARCGPAKFTALMTGSARCARMSRVIAARLRACIFAPMLTFATPEVHEFLDANLDPHERNQP